jgi:undecaprenyl-diphosphatase
LSIFELAFLSIVQGVTEFLPVSSSAHLILGRKAMVALGLASGHMTSAEELAFDIALHIGSLGAVLIYFRNEMTKFIHGLLDLLRGRYSDNAALLILTIVASVPIVIVALIFKDLITHSGRSTSMVAWSTLLFGLLLWVADRRLESKAALHELTLRDGVTMGLAQCLAVIPGVSRSGICMTAGRLIGLDRTLSARFAMLLSVPTILGAGVLASMDLVRAGNVAVTTDALVGGILAFLSAWAAIGFLMRWLRTRSYTPFVVYRVLLGMILLVAIADQSSATIGV